MGRIKNLFLKNCKIKGTMNERTKITADKKFSKQCAFVSSLNRTTANCELLLIFRKEHHSLKQNPFYVIKKLPSWKAYILTWYVFMLIVLSNYDYCFTTKYEFY